MEMHSCQLRNIADPFSDLFPFKKAPKPSFWESLVLQHELEVLLSQRAHTPLSLSASALFSARTHRSLSLSLSLRLLSARQRDEQRFNSVRHRYYVASLILHASIAEITAQLLSLSYVYLISSDDGAIIMIFLCRLTSWNGELVVYGSRFSHYVIFIPLSDNRNSKIYQFYWEFSFIKIQYVGKDRETNVIINNKCTFCIFSRRAVLSCKNVNRFVSVNCSVQRKRSNGNLVFIFSCLIDMNKFFEKHLWPLKHVNSSCFMLTGFNNNKHTLYCQKYWVAPF